MKTIKNKRITFGLILKILAVLLFTTYLFRLFSSDKIDSVFNLLLVDVKTNIDAETTWLFGTVPLSILIIFLRWITLVTLTWAVIIPFRSNLLLRWLVGVVGIFTAVLNILFFKSHLIAFYGESASILSIRGIQFGIETFFYLILSGLILFQLIKNKEFIKIKESWKPAVVLLVSMFALMPQTLLFNLFGYYGEVPKDFAATHIFALIP